MKLQRHFFISDDLDDLERFEEQLEAAGVPKPQVHVLCANAADIETHAHLNYVRSMMKSDLIHSTVRAAIVGVIGFVLVLLVAHLAGWTDTPAGWVPFIFLAVLVLGFCTWEGGLSGIQRPNQGFARFEQALKNGKHIFFVDLEPKQEPILEKIIAAHPGAEPAGSGRPAQRWVMAVQQKFGAIRHAL